MEFVKRSFIIIIISLLGFSTKAKNLTNFGIYQTEFQEYTRFVIKSLNDLLIHLDDEQILYKNDFGHLYMSDENKKVVINNFEDAQFIYFLGYISAIDLNMGNRFDITNTPAVASLRNLYDFYNKIENVDLFPYWIIYNLFPIIETKISYDPLWAELLISDINNPEKVFIEYSRTHDDLFAKDIQLTEYTSKMYELLYGILKSKNNSNP